MISISRNNQSVSKSEGSVALAKAASSVKLTPSEAIRTRLASSNVVLIMYFLSGRYAMSDSLAVTSAGECVS